MYNFLRLKLQGHWTESHENFAQNIENWWSINTLKSEFQYSNSFTTPAWQMDDGRRIEAELQHDFHLLACSRPKLLDQSSPKFYTI